MIEDVDDLLKHENAVKEGEQSTDELFRATQASQFFSRYQRYDGTENQTN